MQSNSETTTFSAFYGSTYPQFVRVATAIVGDRGVAEEVVQDAFAATWRRRASVEELAPYVRRAVVNGCRSHLRRRRDRGWFVPELGAEDVHPELVASIKRLKFQQRAVVVLRYYEGLADRDISRALGIREATVRSTASRALATLREVLRDDD